ncbi:unnamed protein product (macronuclear) [Paramecium tetraurelia]|uniref:Protein kinase domain-containing protein n=1 Tax=Paramecium tetraurelia TaxID=5888 RepID=A0BIM5_PARTE|nr:uncharacterized protein GSPATT00004764001 [Paramecium tetraurelia]CAK58392.1 unnamed protein product [Paramecium tetraurelia]|eukprot:XP_001425790.1 hypothetical protein (macronuclear) [Paramecium tetraurelia strain d4-2]
MDLRWLQDEDNITTADQCDHFNASFISSPNRSQLGKTMKNQYTAVEFADTLGKIFQAIKENNLERIQGLVNTHKSRSYNLGGDPEFKWDIINDLSLNWSPLHHSIFLGCDAIFLWFLSEGGDITSITYDGYSALTLAVLSRNELMVNLLIAQPNLNINHVSRKGSALHIAIQLNQITILQLLLQHPTLNLNIYNDQLQQPIDVATGKAKSMLEKELQLRTTINQNQPKDQISILSSKDIPLNTLDTFIINRPQKPPVYKGYIEKLHFSHLYSYQRYIVIDPDTGVLVRYQNKEDCPLNPKETIPLQNIFNLQIIVKERLFTDNSFQLLIEYNQKKMYFIFSSQKMAQIWYDSIKAALGYTIYVKFKLDQYSEKKEVKKVFNQVNTILLDMNNQSIEIDKQANQNQQKEEQIEFQQKQEKQLFNNLKFSDFQIAEILQKGSLGRIYKATYLKDNKIYVLKQQNKEQLRKCSQLENAIDKVKMLREISHPFLVNIKGLFQTKENIYYQMKYYDYGDLSQYIGQGNVLSENVAKILIAQIIAAIEYLHSQNIVYGDLKPNNVMVDKNGFLKLAYLGLNNDILKDKIALFFYRFIAYLAPEIIKGESVTQSVDVYGIGVLLYEMLTGYPPHLIQNFELMLQRIQHCPINYDTIKSKMAVKILKKMLQKDQTSRPSLREIKNHVFFADINWNKLLMKNMLPPKLIKINREQLISEQQISEIIIDHDYLDEGEKPNYVENWSLL